VLNQDDLRPPSSASRRLVGGALNRNRVAHRLAREIAIFLLESELPEGTRLPSEQELCTTLGTSRTGLRSALRLLESWGLITIQTGREGGPVVRRPGVSDLQDTMSVLIHSEQATLMDVLVARRAIDPIIAGEAAKNATFENIEQLNGILKRMQVPNITQREFLHTTAEFQGVLADASKVVILGLFLRVLLSFGEQSFLQQIPLDREYMGDVISCLERIRDALAEHDSESARAETALLRRKSERHWETHGEALLTVPLRPL
jgi:GntR family transcriptional repressor for pyruvate dehydrogenase complex